MDKRDVKAERLFKNGGVRKVGKDKYEAHGSRGIHIVKKIAGHWICPCEDHQFRFEICYHIRACKIYELEEKKRTSQGNFFNNKYKTLLMKKNAITEQINKIIALNREHMIKYGEKDEELNEKKINFYNRLSDIDNELKKVQPKPRTVIVG